MMEAIIEALTVAHRLAKAHPDLAQELVDLAKKALGIGGEDNHDEEVRAGLAVGLAAATASAVTTAVMRERARVKARAVVSENPEH